VTRSVALAWLFTACGGSTTTATTAPPPQPSVAPSASATSAVGDASDAGPPTGALPPAVIQSVVRAAFPHFRLCYLAALQRNKHLGGRVAVKFEIDVTGHVASAEDVSSSNVLQDDVARSCVVEKFKQLVFPPPDPSGVVRVVYPVRFDAGMDDADSDAGAASSGDTGDEYGHSRNAFDPGAAAAALAKIDVKSCSVPAGFHGPGHVKITFDPSGVALRAVVDSTVSNAATSACVSKAFAAARIPPFSGSAVSVGKSFVVP